MSRTISPSGRPAEPDRSTRAATLRVGCSGWHYTSWRGRIYPDTLPTTDWLGTYARRFGTVEINGSFYRLPSAQTFANWRAQVPRRFIFALKASRFLTHIKRLRDPEEPIDRLLTHARPLRRSLGPILYQLPPRWFPDAERLETFLAALPSRVPGTQHSLCHVMEMRDPRGYEPWVIDLLRRYRVALCVHDMPGSESPLLATGPLIYVRLHGYGVKYGGSYPSEVLQEWAGWLADMVATGPDAYVYFNNDVNGYAVYDAERLRILISDAGVARTRPGSSIATA